MGRVGILHSMELSTDHRLLLAEICALDWSEPQSQPEDVLSGKCIEGWVGLHLDKLREWKSSQMESLETEMSNAVTAKDFSGLTGSRPRARWR